MPSKFLNLSTDTTLGGATPSDELAVSQRAIKLYVDSQSGGGSGSAQSVGNVFWTMRTDNELNGAVECNGATYDTGDFTGSGSIGTLLAAGRVPYVSLAQYATLLSSQGSCGVFGWDGGSTTEFRVPSLNDIFIETGTAAQIGDHIAPGVPNIKSNVTTNAIFNNVRNQGGTNGAVTMTQTGTIALSSGGGQQGLYSMYIDASQSSSIYKDDVDTVQPNTIRFRAMVQLATGATDEALETCTGVLADVADLQQNKVSKGHEVIEFQEPTADNGYTWYRKYADGWVEQGGIKTIPSRTNVGSSYTPVTFPIPMSDTNYTGQISYQSGGAYFASSMLTLSNRQTTGVRLEFYMTTSGTTAAFLVGWQVSGMAAN